MNKYDLFDDMYVTGGSVVNKFFKRREEIFCPHCGMLFYGKRQVKIEWIDSEKCFRVYLVVKCPCCGDIPQLMDEIQLSIAKSSSCSCGSNLVLSNYTLNYIDDELHFDGIYICTSCKQKTASMYKKLVSTVRKIWNNTRAIEIGPTGLKYEKVTFED